jgi:DoxX-like protein
MRWELEAIGVRTRLTLWTNIDRRFISMGAAGWHICKRGRKNPMESTPLKPALGTAGEAEIPVERQPRARRYPMSTATARTVSGPRWKLWTGRLLSFVTVAQLLSSAWFRATHHTYAVAEIVTGYGYPESAIVPIVIAECTLVVLYLVPQTSVLAAIVLTGYLGGAVATHLRIADTARAAIPLVVGILAWGGLYLRDSRIRQLVPFRRSA